MTPSDVIRAVSEEYGVSIEAIRGRIQTRYVVRARRAAAVRLDALGLSQSEIGGVLGHGQQTVGCWLQAARATTMRLHAKGPKWGAA